LRTWVPSNPRTSRFEQREAKVKKIRLISGSFLVIGRVSIIGLGINVTLTITITWPVYVWMSFLAIGKRNCIFIILIFQPMEIPIRTAWSRSGDIETFLLPHYTVPSYSTSGVLDDPYQWYIILSTVRIVLHSRLIMVILNFYLTYTITSLPPTHDV
jgi:hypothetical protein